MEFVGRELAGSDAGKVFSGLHGVMFVIGSDEMTCMPPYLRAAISCADRGRDFRRSFCRRFWNQIWNNVLVDMFARHRMRRVVVKWSRDGRGRG